MPKALKTTKTTIKKRKISKKPNANKITVTLDSKVMDEVEKYLKDYGQTKENFIKEAIKEKISRDRISSMIDYMTK